MKNHLTEEEIAQFIDRSCGDVEISAVREHLGLCRSCFEDYQFLARTKGLLEADPGQFTSSPELISLGTKIRPHSPLRKAHWLRRKRYLLAAAVVVLGMFAGVWLRRLPQSRSLDESLVAPIRTAMVTMSNRSPFVLPGTENLIESAPVFFRSSFVPNSDEISASLLGVMRQQDDLLEDSEGVVWLLGGFLATGQLTVAHDLAERALEAFPDDVNVRVLAGLIAYYENDLVAARQALEVPATDPAARLNLAIVLLEMHEKDEARVILNDIIEKHPGTIFSDRARWLAAKTG